MQINLTTKMNLIVALLFISGCVSVGNEARIQPIPDQSWKYASENYLRDNMLQLSCSNFNINVWEIPIRSKTYFVGPLLPVIPIFYGIDQSKEDPGLEIKVSATKGSELRPADLEDIVITTEGLKLKQNLGSGHKTFNTSAGSLEYTLVFDIRRDSTSDFILNFPKPIKDCIVPPLDFKLSDKTGLRFWAPGP